MTRAMPSAACGDGADLFLAGRRRLVVVDVLLERVADLLRTNRKLRHFPASSLILWSVGLWSGVLCVPAVSRPACGARRPACRTRCRRSRRRRSRPGARRPGRAPARPVSRTSRPYWRPRASLSRVWSASRELVGGADRGQQLALDVGGDLLEVGDRPLHRAGGRADGVLDERQRRRQHLAVEQPAQQADLVVGRARRVGERLAQLGVGLDQPAEREQLVGDLVAAGAGGPDQRRPRRAARSTAGSSRGRPSSGGVRPR